MTNGESVFAVRTEEMTSMTPDIALRMGDLMYTLDPEWFKDLKGAPVPAGRMQRIFDSPDHVQAGTWYGDQLQGVETLSRVYTHNSAAYYMGGVVTDETVRGQGFGKRLMRFTVDQTEKDGLDKVIFGTEVNKPGDPLHWYQKKLGAKLLVNGTTAHSFDPEAMSVWRSIDSAHDISAIALATPESAARYIQGMSRLIDVNGGVHGVSAQDHVRRMVETGNQSPIVALDADDHVVGLKVVNTVLEPGFDGNAVLTESVFADTTNPANTERLMVAAAAKQAVRMGLKGGEILNTGSYAHGFREIYTYLGADLAKDTVLLEFNLNDNNIPRF